MASDSEMSEPQMSPVEVKKLVDAAKARAERTMKRRSARDLAAREGLDPDELGAMLEDTRKSSSSLTPRNHASPRLSAPPDVVKTSSEPAEQQQKPSRSALFDVTKMSAPAAAAAEQGERSEQQRPSQLRLAETLQRLSQPKESGVSPDENTPRRSTRGSISGKLSVPIASEEDGPPGQAPQKRASGTVTPRSNTRVGRKPSKAASGKATKRPSSAAAASKRPSSPAAAAKRQSSNADAQRQQSTGAAKRQSAPSDKKRPSSAVSSKKQSSAAGSASTR